MSTSIISSNGESSSNVLHNSNDNSPSKDLRSSSPNVRMQVLTSTPKKEDHMENLHSSQNFNYIASAEQSYSNRKRNGINNLLNKSLIYDESTNPFYDSEPRYYQNSNNTSPPNTQLQNSLYNLKIDIDTRNNTRYGNNNSIDSPISFDDDKQLTPGKRKKVSIDTRHALSSPHKQDRYVAQEEALMTSKYSIQTISRGSSMAVKLTTEAEKNQRPGKLIDIPKKKLFSTSISHAEMYRNVVQMEMFGEENYEQDRIVRIASPLKPSPRKIYPQSPNEKASPSKYNHSLTSTSLITSPGFMKSPTSSKYSASPLSRTAQSVLKWSSLRSGIWEVPRTPYRVLDAPELQDDYYLNLLDWSVNNFLAVGLSSSVYLWESTTGSVSRLCDLGSNFTVTSVSWVNDGNHLAVGSNNGTVQIWDASQQSLVHSYTGHTARVGVITKTSQGFVSGSRDKSILMRDLRIKDSTSFRKLDGHTQEVCGLKWNMDGGLLASGGNDNRLIVWDNRSSKPVFCPENAHIAAIKALSWSPHIRHRLVSGGGTRDQYIKMWNTQDGSLIKSVDTGSQVCNLAWTKDNRLVSTHGYSKNQILLWDAVQDELSPGPALCGHTSRVLYLSMAPDEQSIATGAGDETLRFWKISNKTKKKTVSIDPASLQCLI